MTAGSWPFKWPNPKIPPASATASSSTTFRRPKNASKPDPMNLLGLYPDSILGRIRQAKTPVHIPGLMESLGVAAGGLAVIGAAVAVGLSLGGERVEQKLGVMGADAFRAGAFILLGGAVLNRLIIGPGRVLRFYILFAVALFLQASAWTLIY